MKVGFITRPNQKGQIVIPQEMRKSLDITSNTSINLILRGGMIFLLPIDEVITKAERESSYSEILKKTQGSWKNDDWNKISQKRKQIEIKASLNRKKVW